MYWVISMGDIIGDIQMIWFLGAVCLAIFADGMILKASALSTVL